MNKHICIKEHQFIVNNKSIAVNNSEVASLCDKDFKELDKFILKNSKDNKYDQIFKKIYKKPYKEVIKAQNYVGIIQLSSGTIIEILPKIYEEGGEEISRKILLDMLKEVWKVSFKQGGNAKLNWAKINLYDIFIFIFLNEINTLLIKGLKSSYIESENNSKSFKGKLLVNEHIKNNIIHKERFYVRYDEYSRDRVENRIIKSTLVYLNKITKNKIIKLETKKIIDELDDIKESSCIDIDLKKCLLSRDMKEYKSIIKWCKMFLKGNSFISKKGEDETKSILFDMNKLFEKYITTKVMKSPYFKDFDIKPQYSNKYLIEGPNKENKLIPDIYLKKENEIFIMDIKWKVINYKESILLNISQSDLYQLYAYAKKYDSKRVFLIYPCVGDKVENRIYEFEENVELSVVFINLNNVNKGINSIATTIDNSNLEKKF